MRRRLLLLLAAIALLVAVALPAAAITRGGVPDDGEHPYVGLMVAQDANGNPLWRCSGTLISDTLFVTAGHCTEAPAAHAEIWFDEDVESGIPGNGYPFTGDAGGTTVTHPDYDPAAFFLHDLGVVVLDAPYLLPEYAGLADPGAIEAMEPGRKSAVLEAVGYGLQDIQPVTVAERVRLKADLMVVDTRGQAGIGSLGGNSVIVSGDAAHGGTCFGDSGGPMLIGTDIAAVTSFGLNGNCAGVGGGYRIDNQGDIDWIWDQAP
jgi:hypothetical protein